jgi:hypothetical protein
MLLARLLAWSRVGIGVAVWAAPSASMRVLGFDPDNPQVRALAYLGGTRDIALGAIAVASLAQPERAAKIAGVNGAVDALDAVAFATALARREGIDRAAVLGTLSATGAAAMGLWLARRGRL